MSGMHPDCCKDRKNEVFNHNFAIPNTSGNFPAGWDKYTESHLAVIYWQHNYWHHYCVMISNPFHHQQASIIQQPPFYVPVGEHQLWEVGASFKVYRKMRASITVHFIKHDIPVSHEHLEFHLVPGHRYYGRSINIPDDIDAAFLEIGTRDCGQIWIDDVCLAQVFPHPHEINVNMVEAVKRIIHPVKVEKITRHTMEEVLAGPGLQTSDIQDVLKLTAYTFCVINQGTTPAHIQGQTSPDGIHFIDEPTADTLLTPGDLKALDFNHFLRFARVAYWTEDGHSTPLKIFFQAQG